MLEEKFRSVAPHTSRASLEFKASDYSISYAEGALNTKPHIIWVVSALAFDWSPWRRYISRWSICPKKTEDHTISSKTQFSPNTDWKSWEHNRPAKACSKRDQSNLRGRGRFSWSQILSSINHQNTLLDNTLLKIRFWKIRSSWSSWSSWVNMAIMVIKVIMVIMVIRGIIGETLVTLWKETSSQSSKRRYFKITTHWRGWSVELLA